jgi:ribosomal-protein-alanine N-acetyltransferase
MTPAALARLHALCFTTPRPWTVSEFETLLARPDVLLIAMSDGFALGRVAADEAEVLTVAVAPGARRQGLGQRLLSDLVAQAAARGAATVFLEVAADNDPARALYHAAGFAEVGRRPGYYRQSDGTRSDALLLRRAVSLRAPDA